MRRLAGLMALSIVLVACTDASVTTTTSPPQAATIAVAEEAPPIYLMLMWHQHQPFYPKDAEGIYTRPWVRVHATKDYWDMAATLDDHPEIELTFNLTPVLLLQLEDLANGAKDIYWVLSEAPADQLSLDEKTFIAERFFDVNPNIVERFPRFRQLAEERTRLGVPAVVESWSDTEWRDLQVLFNLAWTDPSVLGMAPLSDLVDKARDFAEEDKTILFAEHLRIIREVIPVHARLWDEGRIEVTTTPLAHPILPLLGDTALAAVGDPAAVLPRDRFREIADADQQVSRGLDTAERLLGRRPTGMWPGEGAVAQLVMNLFSKNGVRWVATGEDVLAKSLDIGSFTRDGEDNVVEADLLYRPYSADIPQRDPVAMFFRDVRLSDQIGFEYSGVSANAAVDDFMGRLRDVYETVDTAAAMEARRPVVVSVVLDGENAWEHYPNDGRDFLDTLYRSLAEADWVETITPSAYLEEFGSPEPLGDVYPASWFQPNFATWIGEEEEAAAWEYLYETRQALRKAEQSGAVDGEALEGGLVNMLFAEGSDWFWWYGADQDSGDDAYFDTAFRELLGQVYDALGQPRPLYVSVPIIPQTPVRADRTTAELLTIEIDGVEDPAWARAGWHGESGLGWAFDKESLYLRSVTGGSGTQIYIGAPQGRKTATTYDGDVLGFGATHVLVIEEGAALLCNPVLELDLERCLALETGRDGELIEIAVPLAELGALEAGNVILAKVAGPAAPTPVEGPIGLQVPDISDVLVFLEVADPEGDDHGPGAYTYPRDQVFSPGSYDLTLFQAGTEDGDLVLTFEVAAPIGNPWGSPSGLSVQTFDVYIDTDPGMSTGSRLLIPGRNASLEEGFGWEYGITIEGWQPAVYLAAPDGSWEETEPSMSVAVFGDQRKVTVRVPGEVLGEGDPSTWGYLMVLLSQEGFPSPGVRRVRDVDVAAAQWRAGGAADDINHTRIFDVAWPTPGEQETELSDYRRVVTGSVDDLGPDDFATLPVLVAE